MKRIGPFLLVAAACAAQVVTGVANVADARNTVLAPGALFFVSGTGLGPSQTFRIAPPYPAAIGPYSIALRSIATGTETLMLLYSVQAGGTVAIVPSAVPVGDYELIYIAGTTRSRPFPVNVAKRSLSVFTLSGDGTGPAQASAAGKAVAFLNPVKPGQQVTLVGTGVGATPGSDPRADARPLEVDVQVLVGKKSVETVAVSRSGVSAAIDEIRFVMPDDAEVGEGCYVPVRVKVEGAWANPVTLAKANQESKCAHPLGVSETVLRKLDADADLVLGNFSLTRRSIDIDVPNRQETRKTLFALGRFFLGDGALLLSTNGREDASGLAENECTVAAASFNNTANQSIDEVMLNVVNSRPVFREATPLDGGSLAQVTTPAAVAIRLPLISQDGTLLGALDESDPAQGSAITAGEWKVEWVGGTQLAAGRATLAVAETEPLVWAQKLGTIDATAALPLEWAKSDAVTSKVAVFGLFLAPGGGNTIAFATFSCRPTGRAFLVPESVMARMPAAESGRAWIGLSAFGAGAPFTVDYRNGLGQSDFARFAQEFVLVNVREYKR